ncbi:hypothetical protein B0T14DRAFT_233836 [Immersiella caudata]|uniref:Uncharacterized protein n=1 Tax=Immersiella caudata TaxID=314043 RepID=A0AA40C0L0_9PEZI|nr:hypothetical protein B0T14DRAFT_233836 [Immersiella caudata]
MTQQRKPLSFLVFPGEIRNKIYNHLYQPPEEITPYRDGSENYAGGAPELNGLLSLTRTCRRQPTSS